MAAASLIKFCNFPVRPQLIYNNSWGGSAGMGCGSISTFNSRKVKAVAVSSSPWLMLPPTLDGADIVYDFYSLGDDKVVSFNKRSSSSGLINEWEELPDDEAEFVGMSHGWLACYNLDRCDKGDGNLFLSNPVSNRHVKLPCALNLHPPHKGKGKGECMYVENVIISSPDPLEDQNCRAVMIYGPECRLAFCCPTTSKYWTPFGNKDGGYCSVVYSTRQKLLFCLTKHHGIIEAWDLNNLDSPIMTDVHIQPQYDQRYPVGCSSQQERDAKFYFRPSTSLAIAHNSDDLYQARRFTVAEMGPDGNSHVKRMDFGDLHNLLEAFPPKRLWDVFPYKTTDFDVYKYDYISKDWKYMDCSLDGIAIFIGKNHGFALSAADYANLKPDAIYFTDIKQNPYYQKIGGGHDLGIFNYRDKTLSPCYYPCDYRSIKKILPPPLWFTPNYPRQDVLKSTRSLLQRQILALEDMLGVNYDLPAL